MAIATAEGAAAIYPAMSLFSGTSRSSSLSWLPTSLRGSWRRPVATLIASSSLASCPPPRRGVRGACYPPSFSLPLEARDIHVHSLVEAFDPGVPLPLASTPPSSWYTDPYFMDVELERVFFRGWQAVGYTEQVQNPRDFFTGRLGTVQYVVCRDADGNLHAFHNICRHHATLLAYGSGQKSCFVCPYHGWTYGLDGSLIKATEILGIQGFNENDNSLVPLNVGTWGPFVLINMENRDSNEKASDNTVEKEWLDSSVEILRDGINSALKHSCRRKYTIECNWKIFCDNYLDGGYHVPYAHGGLASALKLDSYSTEVYKRVSIQKCLSAARREDEFDRFGSEALYAFVYPNFMINRYGPWMDTNLVLPLGTGKCEVVFDYFLDVSLKDDDTFIKKSLEESEKIQMEDMALCEAVQKGLESPAYISGRYSPNVEQAMHHFHCLLYQSLHSV